MNQSARNQRLIAQVGGAIAAAALVAFVAPALKVHPVLGAAIGVGIHRVFEPAVTAELLSHLA